MTMVEGRTAHRPEGMITRIRYGSFRTWRDHETGVDYAGLMIRYINLPEKYKNWSLNESDNGIYMMIAERPSLDENGEKYETYPYQTLYFQLPVQEFMDLLMKAKE